MFDKDYFTRVKIWRNFRIDLESSENPLIDVIYFWNTVPISGESCVS